MKKLLQWVAVVLLIVGGCITPAQSGVIVLAGDSWLDESYNKHSTETIGIHTGEFVVNVAVGGMKSSRLVNVVNNFIAKNQRFPDNTTVILDIGLPEFFENVPRDETLANLIHIVDFITNSGAVVILSGAPTAHGVGDLLRGNLILDDIYKEVVSHNNGVILVDAMGPLLEIPQFHSGDPIHLNDIGYLIFNIVLSNAYLQSEGQPRISVSDVDVVTFIQDQHLSRAQAYVVADLVGVDLWRIEQYRQIVYK